MKVILAITPAILLAGCVSNQSMYEWGSYQSSLTNYTKNSDAAKFETELRETIAKGERKNAVPPGVYAELGYLLLQSERPGEAAEYFQREKKAFPESATLMDRMIRGATTAAEGDTSNAS